MGEQRGYTCDGGCGASTVIDAYDHLARVGWFSCFRAQGQRPLYACSAECMMRALDPQPAWALPTMRSG